VAEAAPPGCGPADIVVQVREPLTKQEADHNPWKFKLGEQPTPYRTAYKKVSTAATAHDLFKQISSIGRETYGDVKLPHPQQVKVKGETLTITVCAGASHSLERGRLEIGDGVPLIKFYNRLMEKVKNTATDMRVQISSQSLQFDAPGTSVEVQFERTLRVPNDGKTYNLPPGLGSFDLTSVTKHWKSVPAKWLADGGVFLPIYQREAMWLRFSGDQALLRVAAGDINAISGKKWSGTSGAMQTAAAQDYCVLPHQPWLDGFRSGPEHVSQFVAMPVGRGYTVEEQVTGGSSGGMLLEVIPLFEHREAAFVVSASTEPVSDILRTPKELGLVPGTILHCTLPDTYRDPTLQEYVEELREYADIPADRPLFLQVTYSDRCDHGMKYTRIQKESTLHLVLRLRGGGCSETMGLAMGGKIKQNIYKDKDAVHRFADYDRVMTVRVHMLNSVAYQQVTGGPMPPTPVSYDTYVSHNFPMFDIYKEPEGIPASDVFRNVKHVQALDDARGVAAKHEVCSVCMVRLVNGTLKPCSHQLCTDCTKIMAARGGHMGSGVLQCPLCRANVTSVTPFSGVMPLETSTDAATTVILLQPRHC
jgi:hypothetical protein